jgi:3-hydroxyacyl-[acyl-carrier-protein] dehydratase
MRLEYFEMIDELVDYDEAARTIRCRSRAPEASPVFEGHFPGYPVVPGVLMIETMAQAAGFLTLAALRFARMPFLASVKEAKLRSFTAPGAGLDIFAVLAHEGAGYVVATAYIETEGRRISDCELMLRLMPFPSDAFAAMIRGRAEAIGLTAG